MSETYGHLFFIRLLEELASLGLLKHLLHNVVILVLCSRRH